MTLEQLPPQDLDAEKSCIASILLNSDARLKIIGILQPEDFYLENHRVIFTVIIDLDRKNIPIDLITLKQQLKDTNRFEKIGGDVFLVDLYQTVSTSANAEYYAKRIKELSLRRKLIDVSNDVIQKCFDTSRETNELMDEVERDIFKITEKRITSDFRSIEDIIQETLLNINMMYEEKRPITGITTGFDDLDEILSGLHDAELIIIASRPAMGKTSLALNIANNIVLRAKKPALFYSLEMPSIQLGQRLLCIEAMIDSQRVRTGHISAEELKMLIEASERLSKSPLFIDDTPSLNIFELRAKARRMAQKNKLGVIIIDYLQLLTTPSNQRMERYLQIGEMTRALKMLAGELSVPVIALSQLSRAVESRADQRPLLSDLRESGSIEQDADLVLFLYREEKVKKDTEKKGISDIIIAKHRNGPIGEVELKFWEKYTRFDNIAKIYSEKEDSFY